ncbi:unnamed protein product, partial [Prunus brigantina]
MFCSETGKWTKAVGSSPQSFRVDCLTYDAGVAFNGMLYWWGVNFIIGFNPYSNDTSTSSMTTDVDHRTYCCRFIARPVEQFATFFGFLGVCRGRLRIFQMFTNQDVRRGDTGFSIWEFKDDGHQVDCNKWCLVDRFYIRQMIKKDPFIAKWDHQTKWRKTIMVLGLDPNEEDVLYMELCQHLVMYNIHTRTLKKVTVSPYKGIICPGKRAFP